MSADGGGVGASEEFVVTGTRVVGMEATGPTLADAIAAYLEHHHGHLPDWWEQAGADNGGGITGVRESCERPILDGEKYTSYEDGPYECEKCAASQLHASKFCPFRFHDMVLILVWLDEFLKPLRNDVKRSPTDDRSFGWLIDSARCGRRSPNARMGVSNRGR